ncbi:unnamed protein product, partial [Candidula unifasciata]
ATISHRYGHNTLPVSSMKLILENNQGDTIVLIAVGQVADDLDVCVKGDVLVLLKFVVEKSPGHCKQLYQIIADDTEAGCLVWTAAQSRTYSYRPLEELKVNTTVDVYGVVTSYKPPAKTKGSDFVCTVGLTDSSLGPDNWLVCNIFSPSEAQLPKVEVGNVLRLHRLKIQNFQGKKQGRSGPGFHWLLFHGSFENREASSSSYTVEQQDEIMVKSLFEWWLEHAGLDSVRTYKDLSEVQPHMYFNLICQVIRVADYQVPAYDCKVLRVWDGSKFQGDVKMTAREELKDPVQEDSTLMEASAGLAVDVYLFGEHKLRADKIQPGSFIELINLHAAVVTGRVEMTLHEGTRYERGVNDLSRSSPQVRHLSELLTSIVDKVNTDRANALKRQHIAVDSLAINSLIEIEKQSHVLEQHQEASEDKRRKSSDGEDLLEISSNSDQSLQFSDADLQAKRDLASQPVLSRVQDNSISSSDHSLPSSQPHSNEIISDSISQQVSDKLINTPERSSQPHYIEIVGDTFCQQVSNKLINTPEQSSQDSFHTASSQPEVDTADIAISNFSLPEPVAAQRIFLSLKTKPDTQENINDHHQQSSELQPDTQENPNDGHRLLTLSNSDVLSLSSSVYCFETAQFTQTCTAVNTQGPDVVAETEASRETTQPPRCMLTTASTVVGHHTAVPECSLRTVLEGSVCQKHKVLVRVQAMAPNPVILGKLVNFTCCHCGYIESAESMKVQLGTDLPVHVCSVDVAQCQQLEPVIVLSFILTDGQDSVTAYVWGKHAIQFLCDIEPLELLSDPELFKHVQERLETLCPLGSRLEDRPWLECCLFSYGTVSVLNIRYLIQYLCNICFSPNTPLY